MTSNPTVGTPREPFSALVSYWYYRGGPAIRSITEALRTARDAGQPVRLMIDSGAFSAHTQGHSISTADYARWLDHVVPLWSPWLVGIINLDVIGNAEASWANWNDLAERGHNTIPVTHLGAPFDVADRYVDAGCDYLAAGGLVKAPQPRMMRWVGHLFLHLKRHHPHVRLHGLGLTGRRPVERFPWWSVDSSSFGSSYRYGRLLLFDPAKGYPVTVVLPGSRAKAGERTTELYGYGRLLRGTYGVEPAAIHSSGPENRALLIRIAALSLQLWQASLRTRRPVDPPPSLTGDGTYVHNAEGWHEYAAQAIGTHLHYVMTCRTEIANTIGCHVHFVDANAGFVSEAMAGVGAGRAGQEPTTEHPPQPTGDAATKEGTA